MALKAYTIAYKVLLSANYVTMYATKQLKIIIDSVLVCLSYYLIS